MAVFAVIVGANMVGWQTLAAQSRGHCMAGSTAPWCTFENSPRMTAVAVGALVGAVEWEPC